MRKIYSALLKMSFILLIVNIPAIYAINDLIARVPGNYYQAPAYIENAILVSEPHGAYVEHSLTLQYSDHNAFSGNKTVEIIHRFELPVGSVINDLWLWMPDTVMRAVLMDTWSARKIYDSIVSMKRDPAFLSKIGSQYELHVYPLVSGSYRQIRINFITPAKWNGIDAEGELPIKFLDASASAQIPLTIYFRTKMDIWGTPGIKELPDLQFIQIPDSEGYKYKTAFISDIKTLQSLNLSFTTAFNNWVYFNNNIIPRDYNYFQFGILPWQAFNVTSADTTPKKIITGIDFSGSFYKDYSSILPNIKSSIKAALRPGDLFNIIVAGAGKIVPLNNSLMPYTSSMVDTLIDGYSRSTFGDSVEMMKKTTILYCDNDASLIWNFPDIYNYGVTQTYSSTMYALPYFNQADIIAAYDDGFEKPLSNDDAAKVIQSLDSLFRKGGRFLTYYDHNREFIEKLAVHYIPDLTVKYSTQNTISLKRNLNGNIGSYFPESVIHGGGYFFNISSDSSVKAEMVDAQGNPCIISKKVGNGLIVVTGLWPFNDDVPMRKLFAVPLLGLNSWQPLNGLLPLLQNYVQLNSIVNVDKFLTFSNNDSLFTTVGTDTWINNYLNNYPAKPIFTNVNLLDGSKITPPSVTVLGNEYYGNGYFLQRLADYSKGMHFETHLTDWPTIEQKLLPSAHRYIDSICITPGFQNPGDSLKEIIEVNADRSDADRPLFFLASTNSWNQVDMKVDVKFSGDTTIKHGMYNFQFAIDTLNTDRIVSSMMGNEKLNSLLIFSSYDTSAIVKLSMKYHLLCDYSALIALEPTDSVHLDPDGNPSSVKNSDSLMLKNYSLDQNYPNPFNPSTTIKFNLPRDGYVTLKVYDILGREVKVLVDEFRKAGKYSVLFNAKGLASGIYIYRLITNKFVLSRKMLLLK